jgi:hypothetical protein
MIKNKRSKAHDHVNCFHFGNGCFWLEVRAIFAHTESIKVKLNLFVMPVHWFYIAPLTLT